MDDDSLIIELEILNFGAVAGQLLAISRLVANIQKPMVNANQLVLQHSRNVNGAVGPWSRLLQAQQRYAQALASGNQMQIFDAYSNLQQKGKAYNSARNNMTPGGDFMQKMKNLIFSTRFGYGSGGGLGGLHPLIGRTVQALGAAGPLGIAVGAAAAAIGLLGKAAESAAEFLKNLREGQLLTGGSFKEVLQGQILGENAAQQAHAFAAALGSNNWAKAFFGAKGVNNPMGGTPLGHLDEMKDFLAALEILRHSTEEDAIRLGRAAPELQGFIRQVRDMTDAQYDSMKLESDFRSRLFTKEDAAEVQKFMINLAKTGAYLMDMANIIGLYVIKGLNALSDALDWILDLILGKGPARVQGAHSKAEVEHARAMNGHTRALNDHIHSMREGTYGGGERAKGAIPSGMRGVAWQKAMESDALKLGAFAL